MRIGIVTTGLDELQGRTAVLGVSAEERHTVVLDKAVETLGFSWNDEDRSYRYSYIYELKRLDDPSQGFPLDDTIDDMIAQVNPFHREVRPEDCDAIVEIGRYFAFCRADQKAAPDFLKHIGFPAPPSIVPRFGQDDQELDLHVDPLTILAPQFQSMAAVATDRLTYQPGERVAVFALAMKPTEAAESTARLRLESGGQTVPGSEVEVHLTSGLGVAHFPDVPEGSYTATLQWEENTCECKFTVGRYTRSAAEATWVDAPVIKRDAWTGTAKLSLYGVPLPAGTEIRCRLVTDGPPPAESVTLETEDDGLLRVCLPNTHPQCRIIGFAWQDEREHSAQLPLPGAEAWDRELGVRVMTSPHEDSRSAAGVHVSVRLDPACPLSLKSAVGHRITLVATKDLDVAALTTIFPGQAPDTQTFQGIRSGQEVYFDMPSRCGYGFLCVGAMAGDECFEAAAPVFAPTELEIHCEVPERVSAGSRIALEIAVNDHRRTAVAVIVRDARLHSGGGLEAAGAAARLETLEDEWEQKGSQRGIPYPLAGNPPGKFSDHYLSGTFAMRCRRRKKRKPSPPPTTRWSSRMVFSRSFETSSLTSDFLEAAPVPSAPSPDVASSLTAATEADRSSTPSVRRSPDEIDAEPVRERIDTLFADVVQVEGGCRTIEIDVPSRPAGYTVDLLGVDSYHLGWTTHQATFRAQRPVEIHADILPTCVHPSDIGKVTGTFAVVTAGDHFDLSVSRDGEPVPCALADGTPVEDEMSCEPGTATEIVIPMQPGLYQLLASSDGKAHVADAFVHSADRISERVRRLVVLEEGQTFDLGKQDHLFDLRFVGDPDEMYRTCGRAIVNYSHACCEQTASKMLGAWLAYAGGDDDTRFKALGSLRQGIDRLEGMRLTGGFAMYPGQRQPNDYWGKGAYRHLVGMRPLQQFFSGNGGFNGDISGLVDRIGQLADWGAGVYGALPQGPLQSCHDAYLASIDRPGEALDHVRTRWETVEDDDGLCGRVPSGDGAVGTRAETCYAAAVLLSDAEGNQRLRQELIGTLRWIGAQMKGSGRLYSTVDSGALVAFLAAARTHGLMATGIVRLDDGDPVNTAKANGLIKDALPKRVMCVSAQAHMFVDGVFEREIPPSTVTQSISVAFEVAGGRTTETTLGDDVDLYIDAGQYEPGMVAHVVLPPCLACEEGGVRLQMFQRDFEGQSRLRVRCRAIAPTADGPEHGMVVVRNMFVEERIDPLGIQLRVTAGGGKH